jgi:hypothetical protein
MCIPKSYPIASHSDPSVRSDRRTRFRSKLRILSCPDPPLTMAKLAIRCPDLSPPWKGPAGSPIVHGRPSQLVQAYPKSFGIWVWIPAPPAMNMACMSVHAAPEPEKCSFVKPATARFAQANKAGGGRRPNPSFLLPHVL